MQISDDICLGAYLGESSRCWRGGWQVEICAGDKADTVHTVNSSRALGTRRALRSGRADQGANVHGAELSTDRVHHDGIGGIRHGNATDAGNKNVGMRADSADADGVGFSGNATVANVNVVVAGSQIFTGINSQRDVLAATRVHFERP